jgi:hypothetical protein
LVYASGLARRKMKFWLRHGRGCRYEFVSRHDGGNAVKWKRILLTTFIFAFCAVSIAGQDLGKVSRPEDSGFSTERLERMTKWFQENVDKGAIPGASRRWVIGTARSASP